MLLYVRFGVQIRIQYKSAPILNWTQFSFPGNYFFPLAKGSNAPNWTRFIFSGNIVFAFLFRERSFLYSLQLAPNRTAGDSYADSYADSYV
jgi:hypothetical protein